MWYGMEKNINKNLVSLVQRKELIKASRTKTTLKYLHKVTGCFLIRNGGMAWGGEA